MLCRVLQDRHLKSAALDNICQILLDQIFSNTYFELVEMDIDVLYFIWLLIRHSQNWTNKMVFCTFPCICMSKFFISLLFCRQYSIKTFHIWESFVILFDLSLFYTPVIRSVIFWFVFIKIRQKEHIFMTWTGRIHILLIVKIF